MVAVIIIEDRVVVRLADASITNLRRARNKGRDQYYHTGNLVIRVAVEQHIPAGEV